MEDAIAKVQERGTAEARCPSQSDVTCESAAGEATRGAVLEVRNLCVEFRHRGLRIRAVQGLSYRLSRGETLAVVGASGSGKSVSCRALGGLLPPTAAVTGSVLLDGRELIGLDEAAMRRHRGTDVAMVFQDSDRALNPTMRIGHQVSEACSAHERLARKEADSRAIELLRRVQLPAPQQTFLAYPHQLSGGMRQRVMIAIAIAARPRVLIADEPTSSLDVGTRARIVELLGDLQSQCGLALILVSHDLDLVASFADTVLVVRGGRQIEQGPAKQILRAPRSRYTKALLEAGCRPGPGTSVALARPETSVIAFPVDAAPDRRRADSGSRPHGEPVLRALNIVQEYPPPSGGSRGGAVRALSDVSFDLYPGEVLGVVGETGAGKSTLARALLQAPPPKAGSVLLRGVDLTRLRGRELTECRRPMQMVFQQPFGSLNPLWRVRDIVEEPLIGYRVGNRSQRARRVDELLHLVGLPAERYGALRPGQLSGGQCQRVAIARALALEPAVLVCDEAVSSLDALARKGVLDLLERLRLTLGLACVFISHDLAVVRQVSCRLAVLHLGQLCEIGPAAALLDTPAHPYTQALLASLPASVSDAPRRAPESMRGEPPSAFRPPSGCRFRTRCERAQEKCSAEPPSLRELGGDHRVGCHFPSLKRQAEGVRDGTREGARPPSPGIAQSASSG